MLILIAGSNINITKQVIILEVIALKKKLLIPSFNTHICMILSNKKIAVYNIPEKAYIFWFFTPRNSFCSVSRLLEVNKTKIK
ncbi:hypothetical protein K160097B7_29910 [[Clostridium] hylemonae]